VSTAGRVHLLLLAVALAACAIGAVALFLSGGPQPAVPLAAAPEPAPSLPANPATVELASRPEESVPRESEASAVVDARRFDGRGVVRGEVLVRDGAQMPERWSLFLEPHPWLEGHERAASKRLDFEHGETHFEVGDLPLGGYLVRAEGGALNCVPASALLVRGSAEQFVTLLLLPSGFIDGGVLDSAGRPAESLDVTLESVETHQRSTITTDAAGSFLFRDVLDGEYRLTFGRVDSPLLPPQSIAFKAPSLRFPTRTLPPTGSLRVDVIDMSLHAKSRVRITGSSPGAGAIDTFSDDGGVARARFLPPGRYRIDATSEEGLGASASVDIVAGEERSLEMMVRLRQPPH
jgi:hypothetical protein